MSPAHDPSAANLPGSGVVIVGGGPAGLMAAEVLGSQGLQVDVCDGMPSVGRKFLLAGKGGLNLTHGEAAAAFRTRYGPRESEVSRWLEGFDAAAVREWAAALGVATFVGSSGRVFPVDMKAAPLLRAWLHRLRGRGVRFHMRHRWLGWSAGGALTFASPTGTVECRPRATLLALGGASWARLGSDGAWWPLLQARGIDLAPLLPSNCGFDVGWSQHLSSRHAGTPLKSVAITHGGVRRKGEFVLTEGGVEGSLVYAFSAALRDELLQLGSTVFELDLLPDRSLGDVRQELSRPRGPRSLSTHLKSRLNLGGAKAALLHELAPREALSDADRLASLIKALPVRLRAPRPIDEAISSAGGVRFEALDERLMLRQLPGVFCAGEMIDWEAPTGGYLLTACLASGRAAGQGVADWLRSR